MYIFVALPAVWHLAALGWVSLNRLSYSAIIDESENMHARCAYSISIGETLYGPDSHTIQRKDYTPLSFQIQGMVIRFFGLDIRYQRFTALIFGLGSLWLLGLIAFHLTGSKFWGFITAAFFAGIDVTIWFMEVGPQPMHVFFAMLAVWLLVRDASFSWPTVLSATLALFACYWSKQTGLAYIAAGVFYGFTRDLRKGAIMLALSAAIIGISAWWYICQPGNQFVRNVFIWNAFDPLMWDRIMDPVVFPEMLGRFGVSLALILAGVFLSPGHGIKRLFRPELIFLGVAVLAGNFTRLKWGSGMQQVIFGYGLILLSGVAFMHDFLRRNLMAPTAAVSLLIIQGLALLHNFPPALITDEDQMRFGQVNRILATPGRATKFCLMGYNNLLVGKTMYMDPQVDSIHRQRTGEARYTEFWENYVQSKPWDILIVGYPLEYNTSLMAPMLQNEYSLVGEIPAAQNRKPFGVLRQRLLIFEKK